MYTLEDMVEYIFEFLEKLGVCVVVVAVFILLALLAEGFLYTEQEFGYATVVGLEDQPVRGYTGVGTTIDENGEKVTIITTIHRGIDYDVDINTGSEIEIAKVKNVLFYQLTIGDRVKYERSTGRLTGYLFDLRVLAIEE